MKRVTVLLICFAALASACTNASWVRTTVAEQRDFSVALEQQEKKGTVISQDYAHPSQIGIPVLAKLMGELKYAERSGLTRKETQLPVFQAVEIERLAPALADALAKAHARQRIRFISFNKEEVMIFSATRKTEGVLFIEPGGRLNMAFTFINLNRTTNEINPSFSSMEPLQVTYSEKSITETAPYLEVRKLEADKPAPMWVVADLEKLKASTAAAIKAPDEGAAAAPKDGPRIAPVENTVPSRESEDRLREDIRHKLRYLKELRDEGLISEDDFTAKKKQLLDRIQ